MISSFPSRSSISPFRKSFNLDRDEVLATEGNTKKSKRQSLRINTGVDSHQSTSSSISSPSRVRQRLSSLFRSSSPVVMTLKETFSSSNLSQDHSHPTKRQASFSTVSFASIVEQSQEQTPTLLQSLGDNNSSTTLSSSSEASDHMPASPADGAATTAANTFTHHHQHNSKSITDPSFWQPHSIKSNMMSPSYEAPPPSPPPHKEHLSSLAYQVYQILGSTLDEVDEEIEQDWEDSRNKLRQSLLLPKTCERIY
ncbi:hypothetical protein V8B55DRAFT_1549630 [Mucor lusitanicus]|uniref:Uncharacterized protein n=2 Tax=Mucor circinelloides f. lusitanicus TaxID=29924 RepID=A0A168NW92_MUCCL|nr:hypothetical protein FB192DRAFT_1396606 [Mucor lusitanicus]OAD06831.1 hypothetical protein MUCCIDRAFT_183151 [Mucor lusitanicus CBS 277.49]